MRLAKFGIGLSAALFLTTGHAAEVAACAGFEGHSYLPAGGFVKKDDAGWYPDRSAVAISLIHLGGEEYDIDFGGETARGKGARILLVGSNNQGLTILALYSEMVETYTFLRDGGGRTRVTYLVSKFGENLGVKKAGLYVAECSFINSNHR